MRHPFDGINNPDQSSESPSSYSRREALRWMAGASAVPMAAGWMQQQAAAAEDGEKPQNQYALYFVVPVNFKSFSTRRRNDLGVQGTYLPGLASNEDLKESQGFLAWLTADEAAEIGKAGDVETVHQIGRTDVSVQGVPPEKGGATLRVHAAPFQWNAKLDAKTYQSIEQLGEAWSKQFSMHEGVKVIANKAIRTPFVAFADGKVADAVIDRIKEHPQVYAVEWMTPVGNTTKRLGEEGGATTLRVGEEGGVTTQALGEEGGVTTKALGEEGGVSTEALGEEGGGPRPSTRALGEEGGVRPRPQPTTLALGEEGGRGTPPAILPKEPPRRQQVGCQRQAVQR